MASHLILVLVGEKLLDIISLDLVVVVVAELLFVFHDKDRLLVWDNSKVKTRSTLLKKYSCEAC